MTAAASLASWQNFYVIVGSSAGALTGLQFVVIALVTQVRAAGSMRDIHAFGTPTVIHFCTSLLIAALMAAPWTDSGPLAWSLLATGVAGIAYSVRAMWHARHAEYSPDFGDTVWYMALPVAGHAGLGVAGLLLWRGAGWALPVIAGAALAFLFLGVHNAWDTVTFIAARHARGDTDAESKSPPGS